MKPLVCFLLTLFLLGGAGRVTAQLAPIDTTGGRYYQPVFASVTVTRDVVYGSATTCRGTTQQLVMDIYQPLGDTVKRRPLLIFAHGGGFVSGTKADAYPVALCTRLARLGYVTASMEYRLGYAAPADTVKIVEAAIRGEQDMKAAVRFFRRDAATTHTYHIFSNYIIVSGSSAGAFVALHTGYLDKVSEVPRYLDLAALGGLEGTSGSPGYSSVVAAVISLSGATTESPTIIEAGNAPLCSAHGTADATVPYLQGRAGGILPPKYVYGSGRLIPRATALGIHNTLRTFKGAGHVPFVTNATYADTTFWTIRDFLRPILCLPGSVLAVRAASTASPGTLVYPVPAHDYVQLVLPENWRDLGEAQLLDLTGRVVRHFAPPAREMQLARGGLTTGIYWVKFVGQVPTRIVFD